MYSVHDTVRRRWVAPFGNSRIKACSQLPGTYRNVLRPSSPLSAKAFTKCPSLLNPTYTVQNTNQKIGASAITAYIDQAHEDLEHSQLNPDIQNFIAEAIHML